MFKHLIVTCALLAAVAVKAQTANDSTKGSIKKTDTTALKEATISAYKPTVTFKDGMVVMNVADNPLAVGNTVLDLLKMIPGVQVDAQNNVTVNGKTGVGFMMNGRLQQIPAAQVVLMLSSMSAESIASIELIKNPPAKYDAAGTAGLINIVSKKVKIKGFSGNLFENLSYGKNVGSVTAATLNFKSDRLTVFTNLNYWQRDIVTEMNIKRSVADTTNTQMNMEARNTSFKKAFTIKAGVEYELSTKTTIGLNVSANPSDGHIPQTAVTNINNSQATGYNRLDNYTNVHEQFNSPSAGMYLLYTPDTLGSQLKFSADHTNFKGDFSSVNENHFYDNGNTELAPMAGYKNLQGLDFKITTAKLDYTKKLPHAITIETGAKASMANNSSDFTLDRNIPATDMYYKDTTFSNNYNYKEQILAAYLSGTKKWHKAALQIGLRAEQTNINAVNNTNGYTVKQEYLKLFPNAAINYKLSEKNSLQLTYSYRIDRPQYDQLNPVRVFNDPLNYSTGNPALKPQYSHNLTLEYNLNNAINNSLGYTHTNNSFYNYSYLDTNFIQIDTSMNYAHSDQLTYSLFIQRPIAKWYNLQASGNAMYGRRAGMINGVDATVATLAFYFTANNDIILSKGYKLQLNGVVYSATKDGVQTYKPHGSLDVAVQKRFLKNRLSVTLGVYDLLYTNYLRFSTELPGQSQYFMQRQDSRRVRLILNYKLGKMRINRKYQDANDDTKRIKKAS